MNLQEFGLVGVLHLIFFHQFSFLRRIITLIHLQAFTIIIRNGGGVSCRYDGSFAYLDVGLGTEILGLAFFSLPWFMTIEKPVTGDTGRLCIRSAEIWGTDGN